MRDEQSDGSEQEAEMGSSAGHTPREASRGGGAPPRTPRWRRRYLWGEEGVAETLSGPPRDGEQPRVVWLREPLSARAPALWRPAGGGARGHAIHDGQARLGCVRAAAAALHARLPVDQVEMREAEREHRSAGKRVARARYGAWGGGKHSRIVGPSPFDKSSASSRGHRRARKTSPEDFCQTWGWAGGARKIVSSNNGRVV